MGLTRRRFITLASAAALVPGATHAYRWQGTALGASAQIILDHPRAPEVTARALAEIERLEGMFSLYRPGSHLVRLNEDGRLTAPPFELLACLATARRAVIVTGGLFDPTVQPLWQVLARAAAAGVPPDVQDIAKARAAIGFDRVRFDSTEVVLGPGQRLTLNGIAQGFIADRVAELMRSEGIHDVLIDTGEIWAIGAPAGRAAWPVGIANRRGRLELSGRALATSAPSGTWIDPRGKVGHILDPRGEGADAPPIRQISISARDAATADALSTGLGLASGVSEVLGKLQAVPDARLEDLQI